MRITQVKKLRDLESLRAHLDTLGVELPLADHVDPDGVVDAVTAFSNLSIPEGALAKNRKEALALLEVAIGRCRNEPNVKIVRTAAPGDPRNVLDEAAASADGLVVGQRGRRTVAHLLLGSTTTSLLHHVVVPTVVVPDPSLDEQ